MSLPVGRGYPDLAVLGHNYLMVSGNQTLAVSGTAASTPVVAGMISLVNARRLKAGKSSLGWLNPALYANYAKFANDITVGDNNCASGGKVCCNAGYNAAAGWDPVTGLGSVNFTSFSDVLAGIGNFPYVPTRAPTPAVGAPTFSPVHSPSVVPSFPPFSRAANADGWFSINYHEGAQCGGSLVYSSVFRTNKCIVEYNAAGVAVSSSRYTCGTKDVAFLTQFSNVECNTASISDTETYYLGCNPSVTSVNINGRSTLSSVNLKCSSDASTTPLSILPTNGKLYAVEWQYSAAGCASISISSAVFYLQNYCFDDGHGNTSVVYNFPAVQAYNNTICSGTRHSRQMSTVCGQSVVGGKIFAQWTSVTAPTPGPTLSPSLLPSRRPSRPPTRQPSAVPTVVPSKQPSNEATIVSFNITYSLSGITSEQLQNQDNVNTVIEATQLSLVTDPALASTVEVAIEVLSSTARRLENTRLLDSLKNNIYLQSSVVVLLMVRFDIDKQGHSDMADGYNKMTTRFSQAASSGEVTRTLKSKAKTQDFANVVGATTYFASQPGRTVVSLKNPTFAPVLRTPTPSRLPTQRTAQPTLSVVPPKITSVMLGVKTQTTVSVAVTFDVPTVYEGYLYCAGFVNGTVLQSISQMIASAVPVRYAASAIGASTQVRSLSPVSDYEVYCYALSAAGYGDTLINIRRLRQSVTTECCKGVTYSNVPSTVFGDISKYTATQTSSYIFSYSLSAAPKSVVTVTPVIRRLDGTVVTSVVAVPTSRIFTSTSALQGSFYLTMNAFSSGIFYLFLNTTSELRREYYTVRSNITILASETAKPAPKLISARFADAGNAALFIFDSSTNYGQITTNNWRCARLFEFAGANSTSCSWLNSTYVRATFSAYTGISGNYLQINDVITLLPNVTKAQCSPKCGNLTSFVPTFITLRTAMNPAVPAPVISIPQTISACSNLTIDTTLSTGSGSRYWTQAVWEVVESEVDTTEFLIVLRSVGVNLNKPINIPNTYIGGGKYILSLTLTNFFGQSATTTATFTVVGNPNIPQLNILGVSQRTVVPSQAVLMYANAFLSSCAVARTIRYSWLVYTVEENGQRSYVVPAFSDPKSLLINPFGLAPGRVYIAEVTAYAATNSEFYDDGYATVSATIQVTTGPVVAAVRGGYNRVLFVSRGEFLNLDASASTDQNFIASNATRNALQYRWSCVVNSATGYGSSCSNVFGAVVTNTSVVRLAGAALMKDVAYGFQVRVTAADGRSDSKIVSVQNLAETLVPTTDPTTAPQVGTYTQISSSYPKFNAESQMTLFGVVRGGYPVSAQWTAANQNGDALTFSSLTQSKRDFSTAEVINQISFPLAIPGNTFIAGSQVTFRISANMLGATNDALKSYSEITLTVNAAPSGGSLLSDPSTGFPLETLFALQTVGWSDDLSDYPLTYEFMYRRQGTQQSSINAVSTASSVSTRLPSGLEQSNYLITLVCKVYDNMLATAAATTTARVQTEALKPLNVMVYLALGLQSADDKDDTSLALQVVNNAANTLNYVNCTLTPPSYCLGLNRDVCGTVPHTCAACLDGFSGVAGSANTLCLNTTVVNNGGFDGVNCGQNADCLYGNCVNQLCVEPLLQCPSSTLDVCSGNGNCAYSDPSGNPLESCLVSNRYCTATCTCVAGFGGADCSLTLAEVQSKNEARVAMCAAILKVASQSTSSTQLLESLVNSLFLSYSPREVITSAGNAVCQQALTAITALAGQGLLNGASETTLNNLIQTASNFVAQNKGSVLVRRRLAGTDNSTAIDAAVGDILDGVTQNMVNGQDPILLVSDHIQVTVVRDATSSLSNGSYSPPPTQTDITFQKMLPSITFSDEALAACDAGTGYVQMSIMTWGLNPYAGSDNVTTPLLRFETTVSGSADGRRRLDNYEIESIEIDGFTDIRQLDSYTNESRTQNASTTAAFYLTLLFSVEQNFDFSKNPNDLYGNTTFPECRVYDGARYVPCSGCNISTYTNEYVTYACGDIAQICGNGESSTTTRRRSLTDSNGFISEQVESVARELNEEFSRRLFSVSGDDDGTDTQTGFSSVSQFGAILDYARRSVADVFSLNPFAINVKKSLPVLITVGCLLVVIFGGLVWFIRWDRLDHDVLIYAHADRQQANYEKTRQLLHDYNTAKEKEKKKLSVKIRSKKSMGGIIDKSVLALDENQKRWKNAPSYKYEHQKDKERYVAAEVGTFLNGVMPIDHEVLKTDKQFQFLAALFRKHDYCAMFSTGSISDNRTTRWINVCLSMMLGLMLDTLFFSIFYTDNGTCEAFENKTDCITPFNRASNRDLCRWTPPEGASEGSCGLISPPDTLIFTMVILLLVVLIGVPIQLVFDAIRLEICAKRPDFERYGWDISRFWLNSASQSVEQGVSSKESVLKELYKDIDKNREAEVVAKRHAKYKSQTEYERRELDEMNFVARTVYHNTNSTSEEVDEIYKEVREFIDHYSNHSSVPWKSASTDFAAQAATARAVRKNFNVDTAGKAVALTMRQRLMYREARSRTEAKIDHARRLVREIETELEYMGDDSATKDIALIQYFVMEQFDAFKRYALRYQFFFFPSSTPAKIDPILWIAGWVYIIGSLLFCTYWILAWGVQTGTASFRSWGLNYSLQFLQDVLVIQVVKVYVLFVVAMVSIRPQLNHIYQVLNKLAISYAQEGPVDSMHDIRVVQHLSPACRAARLSVSAGLASSKILRQVDDRDLENCRIHSMAKVMLVAIFMLWIPATISIASVLCGELVLESSIPTIFSGFIVANYFLWNVSPVVIYVIYGALIAFYYWRTQITESAIKRVRKFAHLDNSKNNKKNNRIMNKKHRTVTTQRKRGNESVYAFIRYVVTHSIDFMAHITVALHDPREYYRKRSVENRKQDLMWFNMNLLVTTSIPVHTDTTRSTKRTNKRQLIHSASMYWPRYPQEPSVLEAMAEETARPADVHMLLTVPEEVRQMAVPGVHWEASVETNRQSAVNSMQGDYLTRLLTKELLESPQPSVEEQAILDVVAELQREQNALHGTQRIRLIRTLLYKDKHEWTREPRDAIVRMLQKHVGKTQDMRTEHAQSEEYLSLITQYEEYDELVHCDTLTEIVKDVFIIYRPGGHQLSEDELSEVMEHYYSWVLENDFMDCEVRFSLFFNWFIKLSAQIVHAVEVESDFYVPENGADEKESLERSCAMQ